jgi:glutamine cyclotransferase
MVGFRRSVQIAVIALSLILSSSSCDTVESNADPSLDEAYGVWRETAFTHRLSTLPRTMFELDIRKQGQSFVTTYDLRYAPNGQDTVSSFIETDTLFAENKGEYFWLRWSDPVDGADHFYTMVYEVVSGKARLREGGHNAKILFERGTK